MNTSVSFDKTNNGITPSSFSAEMKDVELLVPLYQRLFVWEEEQISQLLQDLMQACRTYPDKPYYIGTLTVHRDVEKQNIWELVDGQQRITVLTLLGMACSHEWKDNCQWNVFLSTNYQESRLRYFARPLDQKDLSTLRQSFNAEGIINANMKRFIGVFNRFKCQPALSSDFSRFVYEKATALVAFLPDSYQLNDLNLYFEKMNVAGKQLEAHEILKGQKYFAKHSARWNAIADGSKPLSSGDANSGDPIDRPEVSGQHLTLNDLLSNGGNLSADDKREASAAANVSDSTRLVMSFPMFLLHALRICIGPNDERSIPGGVPLEAKQLLSTFNKVQDWWKESHKDKMFADSFVNAMEKYRLWMDKWIIHIEDDRPVSPYQQKASGTDSDTVVSAYKDSLWQFQSMLYVSEGEQQSWVLHAYLANSQRLMDDESKDAFLAMLKQQDGKRHPLHFEDDNLAKFSYGQIDRYWFWKLDYILWENIREKRGSLRPELVEEEKKAVDVYTFRRNRSIEHLQPQTSEAGWEGKDLHSFGNLAMISASFNSQQSNDSINTKFGRLKDKMAKKELESIKLLLMFKSAGGKEEWTRNASKNHCGEMMSILEDYYGATSPP